MMTRLEFIEKYGDVDVTFTSYYKYTFTYTATLPDGKRLTVGYGGDSSAIYRHEVTAARTSKVAELRPYKGSVYENEEGVESFYDY